MSAAGLQSTAICPAQPGGPCPPARHFGGHPDVPRSLDLLRELNAGARRLAPPPLRQPLVLYGAGNLGRLARDYLRAVGLDFACVVDRDAPERRADPFWSGVTLLSPDEVPHDLKRRAQLAVSVATSPFAPLASALYAAGWGDVVPFYDLAENFRDRHPLSNGWFADVLSLDGFDRTAEVLAEWADDISRAHHLQFLAWRLSREEWTFEGAPMIALDERYFIPEVMASVGIEERFVDCGAYHGSVTGTFVARTGGRFSSVVVIEPDAESRNVLEQAIRSFDPATAARISLVPHALAAEQRDLPFHDGLGYASQLARTGGSMVRTRTIDSLGLSPTFLKLHLEGGELDALRGALETIGTHRPIVAATTYHNEDGIWRTPRFLMEHLAGYRFLMRLHSWCGTGAVVYAIPAERGG